MRLLDTGGFSRRSIREQVFRVMESPGKLRCSELGPNIVTKKLPLVAFTGLRSVSGITALNGRRLCARRALFGLVVGVTARLTERAR